MKKLLLLILLLTSVIALAQESITIEKSGSSMLVMYSTSVDSADTVYTKPFQYFSPNYYTYPVTYTKLLTSAADKPHITTTVEGSNNGTSWYAVDTIAAVGDSAETYQSGELDLNNRGYWYYRIKHIGLSTNRSDATAVVHLVFRKPD